MMRRRHAFSTFGLALSMLALAGCGATNHNAGSVGAKSQHVHNTMRTLNTPISSQKTSLNPSLTIPWILPSHLPQSAVTTHLWPLYSSSTFNQFPASWHDQDPFDHWRVPPGWMPYIYKNEKTKIISNNYPDNRQKLPLTLYITLQGTVFLYPQTASGTMWPGPHGDIADVPPSTIVAEFVPLKPAVLAGIIPESDNIPSGIGSGVLPVWEKVLHMSGSQINQAVR